MDDLLEFLVGELRKLNMNNGDINKYRDNFPGMQSHIRPPCPACYAKTHEFSNTLEPLPEDDGFEPIRCQSCRVIFYKPVPVL